MGKKMHLILGGEVRLCKSFLSIIFNNHTIIFLTERSEPIKLCLKGALLGLRQFLATESR